MKSVWRLKHQEGWRVMATAKKGVIVIPLMHGDTMHLILLVRSSV